MIRYTIKLRMGARLGLLLLFLMAIGMVGIYGIERANAGADGQYREDVLALGNLGRLLGRLDQREDNLRAVTTGAGKPTPNAISEEADPSVAAPDEASRSSMQAFSGSWKTLWSELLAAKAKGDEAAMLQLADKASSLLRKERAAVMQAFEQQLEDARQRHEIVSAQGRAIRNRALGVVLIGLLLAVMSDGVFVRSITIRIRAALELARTVAGGRLDNRIPMLYSDEIGELRKAFREMDEHLSSVIRRVRASADTVNGTSRELASGNRELAALMREQAASLAQAATSMDAMAQVVRRTADNTGEADRFAAEARSQAERGGAAMAHMTRSMEAIGQSSQRIADIIGEIDSIAFQTNLLALNAAVEAARAGEQGRGFAVVAGEVRDLAQRSAAAAREIKRVIAESQATVAEGTQWVRRSCADFQDIVQSVRKLSDIVGEIAASSEHQAVDVVRVSTTVGRMDESMRKHYEQMQAVNRASQALLEQAGMLASEVEYFHFADGERASA